MVRTRSAAGKGRCGRKSGARRQQRHTWASVCPNVAMCKSAPLAGDRRGDYCEVCTALLACAPVVSAGSGQCHICLEQDVALVTLPMCNRHSACTGCARRILFGTMPVLTGPSPTAMQTLEFLETNINVLLHKQECPFCRGTDQRSASTKLRDMRAGGGKATGYIKNIVERGLTLKSKCLRH